MDINSFGWSDFFEATFKEFCDQGLEPARIASQHRNEYHILTALGNIRGNVTGRFRHRAESRAEFPAVGDWVAIERTDTDSAQIHAVLQRRTCFSRKAVLGGGTKDSLGQTDEQVLAANIDTIFLVSGLDGDFNLRRIERYLSVTWDSGATPVIVLNKSDLCDNVDDFINQTSQIALGVDIFAVSAETGQGLEDLIAYVGSGQTVVFLGSSGVGKSSIINSLMDRQVQQVGRVRRGDGRGRHTTTHRELLVFPDGGMVIDTPGIREIQAWNDEEGLNRTFSDIENLFSLCRFADCSHQNEPGCAIHNALESGELEPKRWQGYLRLQRELKHLQLRQNEKERRKTEKAFGKRCRQVMKRVKREKRRGMG